MLLFLLPVTLTLAALVTDGVADAAAVDKRFALRPVDPLTRRSAMDKNFMRFGRAFDCSWTAPLQASAAAVDKRLDPSSAVGRRVDSNFIRFGRRDSNFIRFGRGEVYTPGDNKIPRRHYDVDVDGLEVRFGRSGGGGSIDRSPFGGAALPPPPPPSYDDRR
ncbi:FMRF-amide neuropeptides-like [Melanaphis sacchari]|uniref:FMRF-amide neuropeptides-like n=1 Tax=Melanaphis sacchari TaxID=742174 RepID=UPI000DC14643|nr:FMRF-amide neuropeptides-like [Melanaphis sacchari]